MSPAQRAAMVHEHAPASNVAQFTPVYIASEAARYTLAVSASHVSTNHEARFGTYWRDGSWFVASWAARSVNAGVASLPRAGAWRVQ